MTQRREQTSVMAFQPADAGDTAVTAAQANPLVALQEAIATGQVELPEAVDVQDWRAGLTKGD